jgi:hypothetical protein
MAKIPSDKQIVFISADVDMTERKSTVSNSLTEVYTMADIAETANIPSQSELSASGTTIATPTVLTAGEVNIVSTAGAGNNAVRLADPVFGSVTYVVNTSGVSINVFPSDANSYIYGSAPGAAVVVPSNGLMYTFTCIQNPNVGVWTFTTPASAGGNTNTATVEYDITLTTDSAQTGVDEITDGFIGATNTVISNVPYVCALAVPNFANALVLWDPLFANYNEIAVVKVEVLSNLPVGDLNNAAGQTPAAALGVAEQAFQTIGLSLGAATKDFTVSCGAIAGGVVQTDFSSIYNQTYIFSGGAAGLTVAPRIALPGDPGTAGLVYQVYEYTYNFPFEPLFDDNGNVAKYFMLSAYLGSGSYPQHSSFPNGTVVEFRAKVTFDLKK